MHDVNKYINLLFANICAFTHFYKYTVTLTHTAERGQGVHRDAAGRGRDFGWLESHLHRLQSNSATVERHVFLLFVLQGRLIVLERLS